MSAQRSEPRLPGRVLRGLRGLGRALSEGSRETARRARPLTRSLRSGASRPLGAIGRRLERALGGIGRASRRAAATLADTIRNRVAAAADFVAPAAVLALVCAFAGATLVASQFAEYSTVDVLTVRKGTRATGSAHAYVLVPIGAIAIFVASQAVGDARWRLGRLLAVLGGVAVVVSLAIDLPQGLDPGDLGQRYAEASAALAGGFWVQLTSGITLAACGLSLTAASREPRSRPGAGGAARRRSGYE